MTVGVSVYRAKFALSRVVADDGRKPGVPMVGRDWDAAAVGAHPVTADGPVVAVVSDGSAPAGQATMLEPPATNRSPPCTTNWPRSATGSTQHLPIVRRVLSR
ncbi:hypothetical protein [Kibdelosporangium philippinense]|uniref:hypothetical protein n=1 Tax=Kibdelosporangium philippinense TaxID=211113 RepID=UPI00361714CA